ncbi:MAG: hypothetical protein ACJAU5_001318 [Maricaulis maris]|jgi:hypothetical protein|uniref:hypothetical protein n=1 Tax=Maricaulis maris TaxID=74318 RepID=UPI003A9554F8
MDSKAKTITPYIRWLSRFSLLLLSLHTIYVIGWAVVDIAVRAGLWPSGLWNWDADAFFASLSVWQEVAFFSSTALAMVSFWLHLKRSALIIPVFLVSYFLYRLDSFFLTLNDLFNGIGGFETFTPMLVLQLALLLALMLLWGEGYFDRSTFRRQS